jgi:hypothetical protein
MKEAADHIDVIAVITSKGGVIANPIFVMAARVEVSSHGDLPWNSGDEH